MLLTAVIITIFLMLCRAWRQPSTLVLSSTPRPPPKHPSAASMMSWRWQHCHQRAQQAREQAPVPEAHPVVMLLLAALGARGRSSDGSVSVGWMKPRPSCARRRPRVVLLCDFASTNLWPCSSTVCFRSINWWLHSKRKKKKEKKISMVSQAVAEIFSFWANKDPFCKGINPVFALWNMFVCGQTDWLKLDLADSFLSLPASAGVVCLKEFFNCWISKWSNETDSPMFDEGK